MVAINGLCVPSLPSGLPSARNGGTACNDRCRALGHTPQRPPGTERVYRTGLHPCARDVIRTRSTDMPQSQPTLLWPACLPYGVAGWQKWSGAQDLRLSPAVSCNFLYGFKAPGSGCARARAFGPLGAAAADAHPQWIGPWGMRPEPSPRLQDMPPARAVHDREGLAIMHLEEAGDLRVLLWPC